MPNLSTLSTSINNTPSTYGGGKEHHLIYASRILSPLGSMQVKFNNAPTKRQLQHLLSLAKLDAGSVALQDQAGASSSGDFGMFSQPQAQTSYNTVQQSSGAFDKFQQPFAPPSSLGPSSASKQTTQV